MRQRFDLDAYSDSLLLALYDLTVSGDDQVVTEENLRDLTPSKAERLARLCLDRLRNRGDVESETRVEFRMLTLDDFTRTPVDVNHIFLSPSGFDRVSNWTDEEYSQIQGVFTGSFPVEGDAEMAIPHYGRVGDGDLIPASDRSVTLSHNQPEYAELVESLDKVIEGFRNDHRLDNELGHEKGALLKALEGGRELLNDTILNVRIGTALLVEPLQRLIEKYDKELVGALACALLPLVLKLFGL